VATNPEAGASLAACSELGWTCALVVDDVVDRASEREGRPCAHQQFGSARCLLAAGVALLVIAWQLGWCITGDRRARIARVRLGTRLVLRSLVGQIAERRARTLDAYRRAARNVNASIYWSLLAPHCGDAAHPVRAPLQRYADHSAVAGRMRNDLLDYWGG